MAKKSEYAAKFMSLREAAGEFPNLKQLIKALQEAAIIADGRYNPDITDDDSQGPREGEHQPIPPHEWLDCELNKAKTSLYHPQLHYAYTSIRILKSALKALPGCGKQAAAGSRGGGRTPVYDWDKFWVKAAADLHNGLGDDKNATEWAKRYDGDVKLWGLGRNPSQDEIRKKLGILLKRLREE